MSYYPARDYNGYDAFSLKVEIYDSVSGAKLEEWVGNYTVTVVPVNDLPIAAPLSVTTYVNTPVPVTLSGSDPVDHDSLTYEIWNVPKNGILKDKSHGDVLGGAIDQKLVYVPNPDFTGADSFTYVALDGAGHSTEATVAVSVTTKPARVRIVGSTTPYYMIGSTLDLISSEGKTVRARDDVFVENVIMSSSVAIWFEGGYTDSGFSVQGTDSVSVIDGTLTVRAGRLTVQRLTLR